jgi:intracellular multiplication protein IcmP
MINEYNLAKEKGVLAPAEFLWLKSKDRTLWYALQNLGRKSFFIEGASAHYHWSIEHKVNKKIEFPVLDNLVDSLRRKNEKYK